MDVCIMLWTLGDILVCWRQMFTGNKYPITYAKIRRMTDDQHARFECGLRHNHKLVNLFASVNSTRLLYRQWRIFWTLIFSSYAHSICLSTGLCGWKNCAGWCQLQSVLSPSGLLSAPKISARISELRGRRNYAELFQLQWARLSRPTVRWLRNGVCAAESTAASRRRWWLVYRPRLSVDAPLFSGTHLAESERKFDQPGWTPFLAALADPKRAFGRRSSRIRWPPRPTCRTRRYA